MLEWYDIKTLERQAKKGLISWEYARQQIAAIRREAKRNS